MKLSQTVTPCWARSRFLCIRLGDSSTISGLLTSKDVLPPPSVSRHALFITFELLSEAFASFLIVSDIGHLMKSAWFKYSCWLLEQIFRNDCWLLLLILPVSAGLLLSISSFLHLISVLSIELFGEASTYPLSSLSASSSSSEPKAWKFVNGFVLSASKQ